MYSKQCYNSGSIQRQQGIKFVSLITDGKVANGRRSEYSSRYHFPLDEKQIFSWSTMIPEDWEPDDNWCVIAQVHDYGCSGKSPNFAIEVYSNEMLIVIRGRDDIKHTIYRKPLIKGEWLDFNVESVFSNDGYINVDINSVREAEYKGSTCYDCSEDGGYFKCGLYISQNSHVPKRVIYHNV